MMSRLDSAIRRLQSQKLCIERASQLTVGMPGVILEIGLGNGRTYDHLKEIFPNREIYVFERKIAAHPSCIPPAKYLYKGDFHETLYLFKKNISEPITLVHFDIGSGNEKESIMRGETLSNILFNIITESTIVIGDQKLNSKKYKQLELPKKIERDRYFMYRKI